MMSAAVSTSRATSRTSKDKSKATAHTTQTKSDGPPSKVQPTEEQMRIAQITSGQDDADFAAITQLMEMTGKSEDTVAVALHDCENDLERAALMLLEGQNDEPQGEWKVEQSKKKKRTNQSVPIPKTEPVSNHTADKSEGKRDRSRDDRDDRQDNRHDGPPRRGRRNGGPPPRLARGRGRDRNNQFGDRNADGDNDGFKSRDGFGDRGGFRDRGQEGDGFRDQDGSRDQDGFRDRENGFGGFGRDRSGDRGRGRGRGNSRFAGRGARGARGGGGVKPEGRPQRFDKGPQIDTWTNETAVNADKEPAGWGETWESAPPASEDWNDDTWQGSLTDTQVFTASTVRDEPMASAPLNDISSSIGQSNSLGQSSSMASSIGQPSSLRQPGSIGSSNSLGQPSTLGQRLDLSTLLKTAEQQQQQANDTLIAQYNQQATESIKNTIGIGSSSRGNLSNLQSQSSASGMNSFSQSLQQSSGMPSQSFAAQQLSSQPPHVQQALQQRPKPQRSKLPPPSKIPASAVEMPGHVMPQLDVQFGVDFGTDSSSPFSFGSSESAVTASGFTTTTQTSSVSMSNHLGQVSQSSESVMSAAMMSSPAKQQSTMSGLEHTSPRTSVFQNATYNTTPPKKDASSPLSQPAKMTPPEPIPFPPSSDMKSSPLMGGQRQGQTAASLAQGSLSTGKTDSGLSSFVQSGTYQSTSYQGHKSSGLSSTQAYTHPTSTQGSSFQSQYQPSQNQYQTGQTQYSSGSNQFQTGANQYQSYPSGGTSFQSQSNYSSSPANQNSLYPTSTQTSSYQAQQTGSSYQLRDSQAASARQSSTNSSSTYPNQAASLSSPPSQTQTAAVSGYNSKSYNSAGHQSSLQTSPLTANKLGDSLSNMSMKDSMGDTHQSSQYDHTTTSTTAASLPTTTSTTSLASATSTIASTTVSSIVSGSTRSSLPSSSKAPPNLPPGVPLLGHQYIVGQGAMPPFYVSNPSQSLQQQLYPGYEDVQLLQQRLPMAANSYYDMSGFPVPSTIGGQDRATLGNVPYSVAGTTDSSKLTRVDAQSPNPTSQQQSTQSAHHPFINLQYGYYYNPMLTGMTGAAPGFQYPTMFPMPPVTNTAHAGTTATTQFQKSYTTHGYNTKGYDDLTQAQDFTKTGYGAAQTQTKGSAGTRTGTADLASSAYSKTHTQGFDKQAFHAGTPPPFNLPMATQAGAMGAPTTPYGAAPFVPMMPHQPHSQMLHHPLQQDSTGGSARAQQATSQAKAGTKPYTTYWGSN